MCKPVIFEVPQKTNPVLRIDGVWFIIDIIWRVYREEKGAVTLEDSGIQQSTLVGRKYMGTAEGPDGIKVTLIQRNRLYTIEV